MTWARGTTNSVSPQSIRSHPASRTSNAAGTTHHTGLWILAVSIEPIIAPRRSAGMTHLRSDRVTHTKNTICPRAREETSAIIHAEGVRFDVPSSAPEARKVLSLWEGIRVPAKTNNCTSAGEAACTDLPTGKTGRFLSAKPHSRIRGAGLLLASKVWSFLASAEDGSERRSME